MRLRRRIYRQCKWDRRNVFKFLCFHIHANSPRRGLNPSLLRDACSQTLSKRKKNLYKNHVEKNGNKIPFFFCQNSGASCRLSDEAGISATEENIKYCVGNTLLFIYTFCIYEEHHVLFNILATIYSCFIIGLPNGRLFIKDTPDTYHYSMIFLEGMCQRADLKNLICIKKL